MIKQERTSDIIFSFLSCSIHPTDLPVVKCFVRSVFTPLGFKCFTVGRNFSAATDPNQAMKKLLDSTHCLIGIATKRLEVKSIFDQNNTLFHATPLILQETSMAYYAGLPFLIFKSPEVTLPGITNQNLYIDFEYNKERDRIKFKCSESLLLSSLKDLSQRARGYKRKKGFQNFKNITGIGSAITLLGMGAVKFLDWANRPECFGSFYYKDKVCQECPYKEKCKIKKSAA